MRMLEINLNEMTQEDALKKVNELFNESQDILSRLRDEMETAQRELFDIAFAMDNIGRNKFVKDVDMLFNNEKCASAIRAKSQAVKHSSSLIYFIGQ